MKSLSVVIPVFNEERNIPLLYQRLVPPLLEITSEFEVIFVDDGSTDRSAGEIEALHRQDRRVKLLSFSRNFGHQMALTAGMDYARGDAVIMLDADLQHPPEVIRLLVRRWEEGYEIVYTVRSSDASGGFKGLASYLYYRVFNWLTDLKLPAMTADFRLLDRKVVDAFQTIRERGRFLRGLTYWAGYRSMAVPYQPDPRRAGSSKYNWRRMLGLGIHGILSFSATPLYFSIWAGLALALFGFAYALYALYGYFVAHNVIPGWTSVFVFTSIVGGMQLLLIGMVGLYISQIYEEVKQRPLYLVRHSLGLEKKIPAAIAGAS